MSDLDEVINLCPDADPRRTKRPPVDRRAGADLDIVTDFDVAQLRNFDVFTALKPIAKTVRTDHTVRMDHDSVAENTIVVNHNVRVQNNILREATKSTDRSSGIQMTSRTDHGPFPDDDVCADRRVFTDGCGGVNGRARVNPPIRTRCSFATQVHHDSGKRKKRIGDLNERAAVQRNRLGNEGGGGVTVMPRREVTISFNERNIPWPCFGEWAGRTDGNRLVTDNDAIRPFG